MENSELYWGICGTITVAVIVLLATSIKTIANYEVGLFYCGTTLTFDESKLHTGGGPRFTGIGCWFYTYPTLLQTLKFTPNATSGDEYTFTNKPIMARSKDGLPLELHVTLQYKFIQEISEILALRVEYQDNYNDMLARTARSVLRDVASEYPAYVFNRNRTDIGFKMRVELGEAYKKIHCNVESLQFLNFELPTKFENTIAKTIKAQQQVEEVVFDQAAARIASQTKILEAQKEADVITKNKQSIATAETLHYNTSATNLATELNAESQGYASAKASYVAVDSTGFDVDDLQDLILIENVKENNAKATTIGVDLPGGI